MCGGTQAIAASHMVGDFTAGPGVVSKAEVRQSFQHSSSMWG